MASRQPPSKKQKKEDQVSEEDKIKEDYQKLEEVQEKLEKLEEDAAEEIVKIENKYNIKRVPFYKERTEIIKKIPGFWKKTFMNHEVLCDCLSENDQKIFDHVTNLNVETFDEDVKGGYKITFEFSPNPWFKNRSLSKEFRWTDGAQLSIVATKVEWKTEKSEDQESFFPMWFKTEEEGAGPDEVAEIIKEEIWPDPAKLYHGLTEELPEDEDNDSDEED